MGEPETQTLRLSASFEKQTPSGQEPCLECVATVLNINHGHNMVLMNQCRKLYEYSYLIQQIRKFLAAGFTLETSIEQAIDNCLQHNIMVDFLTKHREEARFMISNSHKKLVEQP